MSPHTIGTTCSGLVLIALVAAGCSHAPMHESNPDKTGQNKTAHDKSTHAESMQHASAPHPTTYSMQDDGSAWKRSPHMHAFYDATVATFAHGTNIDVDAYETQSFGIFREFARANHTNEQAMLDHLKLIPRQVVGIVKENPAVLKSYDSFWIALVGPE